MFEVNSGLSSRELLLLAHTEALCMSRVGVGRRIPVLVPRDLERPEKSSTQKIQLYHPDQ